MAEQIGEVVSAWDDINPAMALARQPERQSPCSALQPATSDQFRNELTACLTLVAPVGMTEEAKRDWLAVAWGTLKHLPADLLATGCKAARQACDHPAKIVPAILKETEEELRWRQNHRPPPPDLALPAPTKRSVMDRRGEAMTEEDTAELNGILENLGATARYRADGSRYLVGEIPDHSEPRA
jgi:hypothetical protein